jgi:PepSY-associated TM region
MKARTLHRIIGIILLLPFLAWAATGFVFFLKPGYAGAYEILTPRTYPLDKAAAISPDSTWLEYRYIKTVLGEHLIVRTEKGWAQLNPSDKQPKSTPTRAEIELLLKDAFTANPSRYGELADISGTTAMTSTGVEVDLDWNRLTLQQRGKDTDRIDLLYKIHYLQWTGIKGIDRILGFVGLTLVIVLTVLGAWLAIRRR